MWFLRHGRPGEGPAASRRIESNYSRKSNCHFWILQVASPPKKATGTRSDLGMLCRYSRHCPSCRPWRSSLLYERPEFQTPLSCDQPTIPANGISRPPKLAGFEQSSRLMNDCTISMGPARRCTESAVVKDYNRGGMPTPTGYSPLIHFSGFPFYRET
jgi:hypothetical protein